MSNHDIFIAATSSDPATVEDLSANRFRTTVVSDIGTVVAEYQVWTDEEALSFGYERGGIATSDPTLKVFRVF